MRTFADEASRWLRFFASCSWADAWTTSSAPTSSRGYLARLAAAFDRIGAPVLPISRRGAVAAPGLVEALSAREQEVLALLAEGRPNQAIADELVITMEPSSVMSATCSKAGCRQPHPGRRPRAAVGPAAVAEPTPLGPGTTRWRQQRPRWRS